MAESIEASGQKNNSLNFRVRNKNKHGKRNLYLICLPKKDLTQGDTGKLPHTPQGALKRNYKSGRKDTRLGTKAAQ
jgi:hypothetical protein